jgi:hypothetical protein
MKIQIEKYTENRREKLRLVNIDDWRKIISVIKANDKKTDYELLGQTRKRFLLRKAAFNIIPDEFTFVGDCEFLETGIIPTGQVLTQQFLLDFQRTLAQLKVLYDKFGDKGLNPEHMERVLGGKKWK